MDRGFLVFSVFCLVVMVGAGMFFLGAGVGSPEVLKQKCPVSDLYIGISILTPELRVHKPETECDFLGVEVILDGEYVLDVGTIWAESRFDRRFALEEAVNSQGQTFDPEGITSINCWWTSTSPSARKECDVLQQSGGSPEHPLDSIQSIPQLQEDLRHRITIVEKLSPELAQAAERNLNMPVVNEQISAILLLETIATLDDFLSDTFGSSGVDQFVTTGSAGPPVEVGDDDCDTTDVAVYADVTIGEIEILPLERHCDVLRLRVILNEDYVLNAGSFDSVAMALERFLYRDFPITEAVNSNGERFDPERFIVVKCEWTSALPKSHRRCNYP